MVSEQMTALTALAAANPPLRDVATHRAAAQRAAAAQKVGDDVVITLAPGRSGSEWLAAGPRRTDAVVIHFHSGGFVAGSPQLSREFAARLSAETASTLLLPAYRLAPEHPHPAALDDALAAYRMVLDEHEPGRVAVGGASAGGGLALALLVRARDEGLPLPAATYLLSPWLDQRLSSPSMRDPDSADPLNSVAYLELLARHYRGLALAEDPRISPLLADLGGLPPIHVEVGGPERLLDDSLSLVSAVARAGGSVGVAVVAGALHTFPHGAFRTPEASAATRRIALHLRLHLEGS